MFNLTNLLGIVPAKAAVGIAVAAVAVGGGAAAAAVTIHPGNHGTVVVSAVQHCKSEYGPGATPSPTTTGGTRMTVGQCVSAVARTKGAQERKLHSKGQAAAGTSGAATHGKHGAATRPATPGANPSSKAGGNHPGTAAPSHQPVANA